MEKDLHSNVDLRLGLAVQVINTDTSTSGEIIDTKDFESAVWGISSGTITAGDMAAAIWESDDSGMSGATVVSAEETLGAATWVAADDDTTKRIGSIGKKRYQQLRMVSTNSQNGADWVAHVALSDPHHLPIASTT